MKIVKYVVGVTLIAVIVAFNMNIKKENTLVGLSLENVEILAFGETTNGGYTIYELSSQTKVDGVPTGEREVVDCIEGGTNSCTKSCKERFTLGDGKTWSNWRPC